MKIKNRYLVEIQNYLKRFNNKAYLHAENSYQQNTHDHKK